MAAEQIRRESLSQSEWDHMCNVLFPALARARAELAALANKSRVEDESHDSSILR
jgi:hypothetical protein